jgi:hypothetical protein
MARSTRSIDADPAWAAVGMKMSDAAQSAATHASARAGEHDPVATCTNPPVFDVVSLELKGGTVAAAPVAVYPLPEEIVRWRPVSCRTL